MEANIIELANGLRVIYKYIPYTRTVHCGYVINTGGRDDQGEETGMAHFIEHMVFKGTYRRTYYDILNYLDSLGGDLNAYTTKEKTCLFASLSAEFFERATDLLTDITFFSTFPLEEIEKEQGVISEEIDMYRDTPDEAIFEDFDELVFPGHGLGEPILGTKDSIRRFTQPKVVRHIRNQYTRENVVFSIVGNVSRSEVDWVIDKYIKPLEIPTGNPQRTSPNGFNTAWEQIEIPTHQAHEILGGRAFGIHSKSYLPFQLLNNFLGGPAMNSILNLNIREQYGLTYNISSFYNPFQDSGIWGIYYACEPGNLNQIRELVFKELNELAREAFDPVRLSQAKRQMTGQLTLSHENLLTQMLTMAKDLLDHGRIISFAEVIDNINQIASSEILEAAQQAWETPGLTQITYQKAV